MLLSKKPPKRLELINVGILQDFSPVPGGKQETSGVFAVKEKETLRKVPEEIQVIVETCKAIVKL